MKRPIQILGLIGVLLVAGYIGLMKPFAPELVPLAHHSLMMMIVTIGLWIFRPGNLPFGAASALLMASLLGFGVPASAVFSGYSGSAVWSLIPALYFGYALAKTGLGKRIAYFGLKSIKVSYLSLVLMWTVVGVILSLLTPSMSVRVVIVIPIALQCVEICQIPEGSKGRSLILMTAWAMTLIPGLGWFNGTLNGPILTGFYSATPGLGPISFADWSRVSLLPVVITSLVTLMLGFLVFRPKEPLQVDRAIFKAEYDKLGPITRPELITATILGSSFLLFATASWHGLSNSAILLFGLFLFSLSRIIDARELSTAISWDLVLFIGTAMSFSGILASTGLSDWLSHHLVEALAPIANQPWLFVYLILSLMFVWRFVDIATFIPTMAIFSAIAPEVMRRFGIDPMVWVPLLCLAMNSFFLSYTNMHSLIAESSLGARGWTSKHFGIYGVIYFVACLIAMLVAVPYWISLGLFG